MNQVLDSRPTLFDYFAGALLANGISWMWISSLGYLSAAFSTSVLAELSYVVYIAIGILASFLVCRRTSSRHISVALKLVAIEWIFSLVMIMSYLDQPTTGMALALLVCFLMGGIAGAYITLRSQLRRRKEAPQARGTTL